MRLAVLTVNYNSIERTKRLLDSLNKSNCANFEVFIVDNNSDIQLKTQLREVLADQEYIFDITLIEKESNDGWGMGLNAGFNYINERNIPYTFVVTNDSLIDENAISAAISTMDANPDVGICAAKVMEMDGDIQTVGGKINWITKLTGITFNNKDRQNEKQQYFIQNNEYVDDCAWCIRSELMKDIKYPSHLFMYFEELYIQDEVKKKGLKIMSNPNIMIKHEGHGSSGGDNKKSPFNVFYVARNRLIWMKEKNPKSYPLFIFNYFLFVLPMFVCLYAIKRRWSLIKYLFKGTKSGLAWNNRKDKILFTS